MVSNVMNFLEWNDALASHFFHPEMAGRGVFLYVSDDVLADLAGRPDGKTSFIEVVKGGAPGALGSGLCNRAFEAYRDWRNRGLSYPPYIAYLGLFVLAGGVEADFAPHAYYPRLRTLLHEDPIIGQYPGFDRMHTLWEDLETWSQRDKRGELGLFRIFRALKWPHVGIPVAQTLLTTAELNALPDIFSRAALDPRSPVSGEHLAASIVEFGSDRLRNRTLQLLQSTNTKTPELRSALLQIMGDELDDWDGALVGQQADVPVRSQSARHVRQQTRGSGGGGENIETERYAGVLRLRCDIDQVSGRASVFLHCSSARALPDEGLILSSRRGDDLFICDELGNGWSTALRNAKDQSEVDAARLDWSKGIELNDPTGTWTFNFGGSPVRLFVDGSAYGLPGLIEERRLPVDSAFYVTANAHTSPAIVRWGQSSCEGFREIPLRSGFPPGWQLFCANRAKSDDLVRQHFPLLSLPRSTSLSFEGGIRLSGNQFFNFAAPYVRVSTGETILGVSCNGVPLPRVGAGTTYALPADAPTEAALVIEATRLDEVLDRKSLTLVSDPPWPPPAPTYSFTTDREFLRNSTGQPPLYCGALVRGFQAPRYPQVTPSDLSGYGAAILLGRIPGQISRWPEEEIPSDWSPVWLVIMNRRHRGLVTFCGVTVSESEVSALDTGNLRDVSRWKNIVWHGGIRLAFEGDLLGLWHRYQTRARRG